MEYLLNKQTRQELEFILGRFEGMLKAEFYQIHSKEELEEAVNLILLELYFRYSN